MDTVVKYLSIVVHDEDHYWSRLSKNVALIIYALQLIYALILSGNERASNAMDFAHHIIHIHPFILDRYPRIVESLGQVGAVVIQVEAVISMIMHVIRAIDADTMQTDGTFIMNAEDFNTEI